MNVEKLDVPLNNLLLQLNELYSEMAQNAQTDYDQVNHHDNGILKIIEMPGNQMFYQKEKDWHYLAEERRYISLNEESSWRTVIEKDGEIDVKKFYIG